MIRRGFLTVDPALLAWVLETSESTPSVKMSAIGTAWHSQAVRSKEANAPFLRTAVELTRETNLTKVRWWASVLREDAEYGRHRHDGQWAFVYHLTEGAAVHFEEATGDTVFAATPGQILVFRSNAQHWTDAVIGETPRVSIAGNLYFRSTSRS